MGMISMWITSKFILNIKILIHATNISFFLWLIWLIFDNQLGADPVNGILRFTGISALNTLFLTLMISPIIAITKQGLIIKCRRLIGLYCFFWASIHMLTYFSLDLGFNFSLFGEEILKRPYLTLGAICWLILLSLAITSTAKMQRKMGRTWQLLHYSVYIVLIVAPIHFYWSTKSEIFEPSIYFIIALVLLSLRWKKIKRILIR